MGMSHRAYLQFSLHDDIETLLSVDSAVLILSASSHALMQLA